MTRICAVAVFALLSLVPQCPAKSASKKEPEKPATAIEGDWQFVGGLVKGGGLGCTLIDSYKGNNATGLLQITRTPKKISLLLIQDGFSKTHSVGWIEFQFDAAAPIKVEIDPLHDSGVLMMNLEKRMADAFVARFDASKTLAINYPSWPEEYPASISLPSSAFKQTWDDCITKNFPQTGSATTSAK